MHSREDDAGHPSPQASHALAVALATAAVALATAAKITYNKETRCLCPTSLTQRNCEQPYIILCVCMCIIHLVVEQVKIP